MDVKNATDLLSHATHTLDFPDDCGGASGGIKIKVGNRTSGFIRGTYYRSDSPQLRAFEQIKTQTAALDDVLSLRHITESPLNYDCKTYGSTGGRVMSLLRLYDDQARTISNLQITHNKQVAIIATLRDEIKRLRDSICDAGKDHFVKLLEISIGKEAT